MGILIDENEVSLQVSNFRSDLLQMPSEMIVRSKLMSGDCFIFDAITYSALRSEIATHFGLHHNDVLVVGSAKLGFSIAPSKRYSPFSNTSDIDVAIISTTLFDTMWMQAYEFDRTGRLWDKKNRFIGKLFEGWLRPDLLPRPLGDEWFDYFRKLTNSGRYGPYKINGGLYKQAYFLEHYQQVCIDTCKEEISL